MTKRYETCLELNEIIYHLTGRFWKQTYNNLLGQLSGVESDDEIKSVKAIKLFREEVIEIARENGLIYKTSNLNGRIYISLIPYQKKFVTNGYKQCINMETMMKLENILHILNLNLSLKRFQ